VSFLLLPLSCAGSSSIEISAPSRGDDTVSPSLPTSHSSLSEGLIPGGRQWRGAALGSTIGEILQLDSCGQPVFPFCFPFFEEPHLISHDEPNSFLTYIRGRNSIFGFLTFRISPEHLTARPMLDAATSLSQIIVRLGRSFLRPHQFPNPGS